jgi:hypothetical protein
VDFFWRARRARALAARARMFVTSRVPFFPNQRYSSTKFRINVYGLYVFIIRRVVDLTFQNNIFKPNPRTAVQGIPVLGYFFWYTVLVSTFAVVTFPYNLCTKSHPAPRSTRIMKN